MGPCLSCLARDEDDEYERTSLLRSQEFLSDEQLHEELLKKQQRQAELNHIVNELSDNLIDVSTFLSPSSHTPNLSVSNYSIGSGGERTYPHVLGREEKDQVLSDAAAVDPAVRDRCRVVVAEPLFLKF